VTLVVVRRVPASEGFTLELRFAAATKAAAERAYGDYCREAYERSVRQHERRQKWGPF
jgi:hypothetical protein